MFGNDSMQLLAAEVNALIDQVQSRLDAIPGPELGEELIGFRRAIERLESVSTVLLRRFDKGNEYATDGAGSAVAWMRWKCGLTGTGAAQRVGVARVLAELPETEAAFARGDIGYQHAALITKTAEDCGIEAVREAEGILVQAARETNPARFRIVTGYLRHALEPEGALEDANDAHERRRLHLSESWNGLFYLDGLLDPVGGATLATALNALSKPIANDERSAAQRRADALVEICRRALDGGELPEVGGQKPHVTLTTSLETLASAVGQPAADLEWGVPVPAETVRRLACDCGITMVVIDSDGKPLDAGRRTRTISPALRRALGVRDKHCRFPGCDRPLDWTDGHHLKHWIDGGETKLSNLVMLCGLHHRKVHEEGWTLAWGEEREILAIPPERYRKKLRPVASATNDLAAG